MLFLLLSKNYNLKRFFLMYLILQGQGIKFSSLVFLLKVKRLGDLVTIYSLIKPKCPKLPNKLPSILHLTWSWARYLSRYLLWNSLSLSSINYVQMTLHLHAKHTEVSAIWSKQGLLIYLESFVHFTFQVTHSHACAPSLFSWQNLYYHLFGKNKYVHWPIWTADIASNTCKDSC